MKKEKYISLPDFIQDWYEDTHKTSQPIQILEHIVLAWKEFWASDIHIVGVSYDLDSLDTLVDIKFRIDWKLNNYIYNLSESLRNDHKSYLTMWKYAEWMRWIKNVFDMDYSETEIAQDAAYNFEHKASSWAKIWETKIRVSTISIWIPILWAAEVGKHESLVMRIINDSIDSLPSFNDLLIMPKDVIALDKFLYGQKWAFLTSGPTWSWKSVTLQTLLNRLSNDEIKIHTLEDPIEYRNPRLVQTQINISKGFWWADWLKSLVRQDPDVIMVWEVRDEQSAELFIEAALTGHQWLTSTHAKTACWAFDRLRLMWVKPYLITWWVSISMSQRLSQKLCNNCKVKVTDELELKKLAYVFDLSFSNFDLSSLSPEDICMMIWDYDKKDIWNFNNAFSKFSLFENEIRNSTDEMKIISAQKSKSSLNKDLLNSIKSYFLENSFKRKVASTWDDICLHCWGNWIKWRIVSIELVETTEEIADLILNDTPLKHLEKHVRDKNVLTLDRYWIIRHMQWFIDYTSLQKLI